MDPHRSLLFQRMKTLPTYPAHPPKRFQLSPARPNRQTPSRSGMSSYATNGWPRDARHRPSQSRSSSLRRTSSLTDLEAEFESATSEFPHISLRTTTSVFSSPRPLPSCPPASSYLSTRDSCAAAKSTPFYSSKSLSPTTPGRKSTPSLALVPNPRAPYSLLLPQKPPASCSTVHKIEGQAGVFLVHRRRWDRCIPSHRSLSRNAVVWLLLKERKRQRPTRLGRHYRLETRPLLHTSLFRRPSVVQRLDRC